ncbi:MAG TPA: MBL fold metallo-hydrolase, partial [Acidimicrobiales bacterium]|nr:MBL fold metallo-hydrolase [Acidimicrobiales bacterium]
MSAGHGHGGPPGPAHRQEVADGVWAHLQPDGSWWLNNAGFLVGGGGVVVVDTAATAARTAALRASIAQVTGLPVRTLVDTHHHGDHTFGNAAFPEATIVAHEAARRELLAAGGPPPDGIWTPVEWGRIVPTAPQLTFSDGVDLWV